LAGPNKEKGMMKEWRSIKEVLDFAIGEEEAAAEFYQKLSTTMKSQHMRQIFLDFADEEKGHKAKLLKVKEGHAIISSRSKVNDLKIGDYLVDPDPVSDIDYQQALTLAMKKEKAAFKLYTNLAAMVKDGTLRETFLGLAQEEAKHKLRFEVEYDEEILREN
jgi:rubrerythrin